MYGGPQERGYRPGTTPVALIAGFALAADLCEKESSRNTASCREIKESFMKTISGLDYTLNGDQAYCIPSTINISFNGVDAEGVFVSVKEHYALSSGSACNSGSYEPSYVLTAMGFDEMRIASALRLSWDGQTQVDFSNLVDYIKSIV
jgi:cysteine desulfurase